LLLVMGTAKRERQKANRAARIEAAEQDQATSARKRRTIFIVVGIAGILVLAFLYSVLAGGDDDSTPDSDSTPEEGLVVNAPAPGATISGETPCPAADGSEERTTVFEQAPPTCIDPAKSYTAIMTTSLGELTIELDAQTAPITVNNFVVLSRYQYYDGIPFHRIVGDFVAQAGDPVPNEAGLGSGGPGYSFEDELPESTDAYVPGTLAMANSGPNTNGSQFFIYYGPNPLPSPSFTAFGQVTEGFDTVGADIASKATANERPSEEVVIENIEIVES